MEIPRDLRDVGTTYSMSAKENGEGQDSEPQAL